MSVGGKKEKEHDKKKERVEENGRDTDPARALLLFGLLEESLRLDPRH